MNEFRGAVGVLACALLALVGCGGDRTLAFSSQPASTLAGEALAPVVVELRDADGKPLADAKATVTLRLVGEGASLSGTLSQELSAGKATFADLAVEGGAQGLVLEASSSGADAAQAAVQSDTFDIEALALRFLGLREAYRADLPLDAFRVQVVSAKDGRQVPVRRSITLGVGNNPTGAVLAGAQATAVDGEATFSALQVDRAGEGYTLVASAQGASGTSSAFTLRHGQDEREPKDKAAAGAQLNDTAETAERIAVGVPVFGDLTPSATSAGGTVANDVDTYRFSAHAGELLQVATYATRLDQAHWKHGIRITLVAVEGMQALYRMSSSDSAAEDLDFGLKQVRIPADGDYLLVLQPDAVSAGVDAELDGGRYAAWVQLSGAPALLQLEAEGAGEAGKNDTQATAEPLVPGQLYGYYEGAPAAGSGMVEGDIYKIQVAANTRIRLALTSHRNGQYLPAERAGYYDPELELYDAAGTLLWNNDDTYWYDSTIEQLLSTAGDYYVRVTRCCGVGAAPYFLSYSAEAVQPTAQPSTNTAPDAAMAITYGQYVKGTFASAEDVRWFKFNGKAGDLVELFPFDGRTSDSSTVDLDVQLYAATTPDTGLSFAGVGTADVHRTILVRDGEYRVRLAGDAGDFTFLLQRFGGAAFEVEGAAQAAAFDAQGWAAGLIDTVDDVDGFALEADAGQLVSLSLYAGEVSWGDHYNTWNSALAPVLQVLDAQGQVVASAKGDASDASGQLGAAYALSRSGASMELSFRAPARGRYTFTVAHDAAAEGAPDLTASRQVSALGVAEPPAASDARYYAVQLWKNQ